MENLTTLPGASRRLMLPRGARARATVASWYANGWAQFSQGELEERVAALVEQEIALECEELRRDLRSPGRQVLIHALEILAGVGVAWILSRHVFGVEPTAFAILLGIVVVYLLVAVTAATITIHGRAGRP